VTFGFTGTSKSPGMAPRQLKAVRQLLYHVTILHLGDAVNADAQAHLEAVHLGIKTIGHPPTDPSRRAFCTYDEEREPQAYLVRNHGIVHEALDGLIAAPSGFVEQMRGSGTWATVRYARKLKRRVWVVLPDGTKRRETGISGDGRGAASK
jgi:hypothetical protein